MIPLWIFDVLKSKAFWIAILAAALLGGAVHYKGKYDDAIAKVESMEQAEAARKKAAAAQALHELKNKERTDDENANRTADLNRELARLRGLALNPIGPAPAASKCPEGQICFDAAEFDGARRNFYTELRSVAGDCKKVAIDLDSAKAWANGD